MGVSIYLPLRRIVHRYESSHNTPWKKPGNKICYTPSMGTRLALSLSLGLFLLASCTQPEATQIATPINTAKPVPTATAPPLPIPALTLTPTPTPIAKIPITPTNTRSIPVPPLVSPDSPIEEPSPTSDSDLTDIAFGYIRELSEELGPRESGTEQERLAAEYLASKFESFGYSTEVQPFMVEFLSPNQTSLILDEPGPERVEAMPLAMSGSGRVSGILVPIRLGMEEDIPEGGLKGKIALAKRGLITFEEKVNRARSAGAIGVVIYNNQPGNFKGALLNPGQIPAISISQEDGERIEQLVSQGTIGVTISIQTEKYLSQNVIAEKPGLGEKVVVLGAHYDTVPNVPGANDNASGTAVLLTLAQALSQTSFPFGLRFIAFGSEELGLRGSQFYVNSLPSDEPRRTIAMLNFDALGSGDGLGVTGASDLTNLVVEHAASLGIEVRRSRGFAGASSDHASFARVDIPVIVFFSDDFSGIHTPQDTIELINPTLLGDAARLALALLTSLAASDIESLS